MAPLHKKTVAKNVDDIPNNVIVKDIYQLESKNSIENTNDRPKINLLDIARNTDKKFVNNTIVNSNKGVVSNSRQLTLCTYTPSNDFVYQNDGPYEPGGSNQTMDYMSSKFLNDNLYQASFFTFSPSKNRIVYTKLPKIV